MTGPFNKSHIEEENLQSTTSRGFKMHMIRSSAGFTSSSFVESLDMIFSQYRETCEVLLDYQKIGGDDIIEDYAKKAIRNLLHENIDVHSRRLIAEFSKDGIKCIEKLQ